MPTFTLTNKAIGDLKDIGRYTQFSDLRLFICPPYA